MSSTPLLPHDTRRSHRYAVAVILIAEGLERLAYYGLVGNIMLYLTSCPVKWSYEDASAAASITTGVTFFLGVIGGWLSDTFGYRSYHIIAGYLVFLAGLVVMTTVGYRTDNLSVCENNSSYSSGSMADDSFLHDSSPYYIWLGLLLSAVGAGVVRINMAPFGGDQVRPDGMPRAIKFFNYFYWAINVGGLISYSAVLCIQWFFGYLPGFLTPTLCALLSLILFTAGKLLGFFVERKAGSELCKTLYDIMSNAKDVKETKGSMMETLAPPSYIDYAKSDFGGKYPSQQVEDMKSLGKVALLFLLMFPYWTCYGLMTNVLFSLQGNLTSSTLQCEIMVVDSLTCNLHTNYTPVQCAEIGSHSFSVNYESCQIVDDRHPNDHFIPIFKGSFEIFAVASIVIFLPITAVFYQYMARTTRRVKVTTHARMVAGLLFATLSLTIATIGELFRHMEVCSIALSQRLLTEFTAVDFTVPKYSYFWLAPQYWLKGMSEIFAIVAGLEYAYVMAPQAMQGIIIGLYWMFDGLGYFMATCLQSLLIHYPDVYFNHSLRNILTACCSFLFVWTIIFGLVTYHTPLGLKKVIIIGERTDPMPLPNQVNG